MRPEAAERAAALAGVVLVLLMLAPYALGLRGWVLYTYWAAVAVASYAIAWVVSGVWRRGGQA